MEDVSIDYELQYTLCELADERVENKPVLVAYYDTHFERSEANGGVHMLNLDEHDQSKVYRGTLKGKAKTLMGDSIPETACIGFASYAQRRNEYGMACYTNAGTAHVRFGDVLKAHQSGRVFSQEVPLLMETTRLQGEPVEKGRISFKVTNVRIGSHVRIKPANQCILGAPLVQIDRMLETFINRRVETERQMADTWPGIANVRAPMDISSAGIELTKNCFLPVEGFALAEPLEINVDYFQNAYERAMLRRNLDPVHSFDSMDKAHQAEVMAEVCTYAAQSFDYISDTVDRSSRTKGVYQATLRMPFEDFNNMGTTLSGDCEDGSRLTQDIFGRLKNGPKVDAKKYPQLTQIQSLASRYTYFLTLATVHGAKAEDETEHIGAHMYGMLIPTHQLRRALQNNSIGAQVLSQLPIPAAESSAGLPTLFCEGTGRIRPLGPGPVLTVKETVQSAVIAGAIKDHVPASYDPLIAERALVSKRMRSKGGLKVEIPHDFGMPSNFYLGNLLFVTNEFLDLGYNVGAMVCGQLDPVSGEITRGATFVDIINQHANFALVPCEPIPEPIVNVMREATALRAPPRPFVLDKTKPMSGLTVHPLLEQLKARVASFKRQGQSPFGSVDIFMRDHQFNAASLRRMGDELAQLGPVYKVDYELEHITNKIHQYRLRIFMDHAAAAAVSR